MWAAEERNRIHLEQLSVSIWQSQINGLQEYHTLVLQCLQACHCPSQYIPKGLAAALIQDGHPVACASKALTPVEQCYANIECEMLACVFRAEWFHTYVFGCTFTIESDHKPLEQIGIKNLADTPVNLQRMLLQLQNYDVTIKYWPGKDMLVADALSHYAPLKAPELPLDNTINHVHITPNRKTEFQTFIQDDPLLHSLAETITTGWPNNINDVPNA